MKQGRKWFAAVVALGLVLVAATWHAAGAAPSHGSRTANTAAAAASPRGRSGNALRQFTGYVSALDKSSLTVERRGKKPESRVFMKDEACRTTGAIEKEARVTVFYREQGGQLVAHRVVAKPSRKGVQRG